MASTVWDCKWAEWHSAAEWYSALFFEPLHRGSPGILTNIAVAKAECHSAADYQSNVAYIGGNLANVWDRFVARTLVSAASRLVSTRSETLRNTGALA